jgi:hypothetical protein
MALGGDVMDFAELCIKLDLPDEVKNRMFSYMNKGRSVMDVPLREKLKKPEYWEKTISEIRERVGEDADGFCVLFELLAYCSSETYEKYQGLGIDEEIFIATMKFCTRFINEHKRFYGNYAFTWAWWFPRQLTLSEFRIGELEFEFVNGEVPCIQIHIPSDANLKPDCVQDSLQKYHDFLARFFPEWMDSELYCESWMLSPALQQLLPADSNIIRFQNLFRLESVDYESMAVLDWVYPGAKPVIASLPEQTSLQRKMKHFLLEGGKVGWGKGILAYPIQKREIL